MRTSQRIIATIAAAGCSVGAWAQSPRPIAPVDALDPAVIRPDPTHTDAATVSSPLRFAADNAGYGVRCSLAAGTFERLNRSVGRLSDFPLAEDRTVTLELHSFQVTTPGATIVEGTDAGDVNLPLPPVTLFRGSVEGVPGSWVFLGVTPGRINGIIHVSDDEEFIVAPVQDRIAAGASDSHVVYNRFETDAGSDPSTFRCTAVPRDGVAAPSPSSLIADAEALRDNAGGGGGIADRGATNRVCYLAVDCDWEFRNLAPFSSTSEAAAYVIELIGVVNVIYERDVQTRMFINFLRVWSTSSDPYDAADTEEQLPEFENYISNNLNPLIFRDVSHLLSGRDLGGGRGFIDVLCDAYSVSGNMAGTFPQPAPQNYTAGNWDIVVIAHEIGHNFGSPHTHCYDPPIDTCAGTLYDCEHPRVCQQGELMSYCHTCSGGISNIRLGFVHPAVLAQMYEDVDCFRTIKPIVYVDGGWGGAANGNPPTPYHNVAQGFAGVAIGGTIRIRQGSYPPAITFDRAVTLEVWDNIGTVTIGD